MDKIPAHQVSVVSVTHSDRNGRLFQWQGNLYRGIRPNVTPLYQRLFSEGIIEQLVGKHLLINTEKTSFSLDGYDFVVRHRRVPCISYAYEWSPHMLKDAALLILDLNLELARYGLGTQDAHSLNVLFDGFRPLFVDFSSIVEVPSHQLWPAYKEFSRHFLHPLKMYSMGQQRITRWLLHDYDTGIRRSDYEALFPFGSIAPGLLHTTKACFSSVLRQMSKSTRKKVPEALKKPIRYGLKRLSHKRQAGAEYNGQCTLKTSRLRFLEGLKSQVEEISIPNLRTEWSGYYEGFFPDFIQAEDWTLKHTNVANVLGELQPSSVLDIGSNQGWYSQLAARNGSRVVAIDTDEPSIDKLYQNAKSAEQSILPLVIDLTNPSPGYGLRNNWLLPALERLPCDLVLALALVHHLVFKKALDFQQITETFAELAQKWLLVEFIPPEDRFVSNWYSENFSWYQLDNFLAALDRYFEVVQIMDSYESPRQLIFCVKRHRN